MRIPLDRSFVNRDALGSEPLYRDLRDQDRLVGVNVYTEYQVDWPERVAMDMVRDTIRLGAVCRNYTPVVGLGRNGDAWRLRLSNAAGVMKSVCMRGPEPAKQSARAPLELNAHVSAGNRDAMAAGLHLG